MPVRPRPVRPRHPVLPSLLVVALVAGAPATRARAQSAQPAATDSGKGGEAPAGQHKFNPYGSPLDTLLSTRLWADVPPAQNFVKESRPDPGTLDYKPLTGTDPARPKPRDPEGVAALQAELEAGIAKNAARAKPLQGAGAAAPGTKTHAKKVARRPAKRTDAAAD